MYRIRNDAAEIDFHILDDERKIVAARFYGNGFLAEDRRKKDLLSRLGVQHAERVKQFRASCDAANLEINFSHGDLLEAKVIFEF